MDDRSILRVSLIGHSFIRRLGYYMNNSSELSNLKLNDEQYSVTVNGRGGLKLRDSRLFRDLLNFEVLPHICFMQIGENDILLSSPNNIARDILSLASYIHLGVGVQIVLIGQLFRRRPWASSNDFNDRVIHINKLLMNECKKLDNIHFWHHRGFWKSLDFLSKDGVHLRTHSEHHVVTSSPMHRFWRSIRSAVLHYRHKTGQYINFI